MAFSEIELSIEQQDYLVNGKPLLQQLRVHEGIDPSMHIPSIGCQPNVISRLNAKSVPDLYPNHVAIYLCSHCGDYDGAPIGAKIEFNNEFVSWNELGFFPDTESPDEIQKFNKVTSFKFSLSSYMSFLKKAEVHAH